MKFIDSENKTSAKTLKKSSLSKLQTSKHHIVPRVQSKDSFEISRFQQKERHQNIYRIRGITQEKGRFGTLTAATRKQILRKPVSENEQLLIKHSDRMMLLFWSDEVELGNAQKIIISADFLLDQDSFWEGKGDMDSQQIRNYSTISLQGIGSLQINNWKVLHRQHFVIWIVRRKLSYSKLQNYATLHTLPLHAVFYAKCKRNYTTDYGPICRQIQRHHNQSQQLTRQERPVVKTQAMDDLFRMQAMKKTTIDFHYKSTNTNDRSSYRDEDSKKKLCRELIILETVKMNTKDIVVYETYEGRIPILFHCFAKVGFLRMKDIPPGLQIAQLMIDQLNQKNKIYRNLTVKLTQCYQMTSIEPYLAKYVQSLKEKVQQNKNNFTKLKKISEEYDEEQIDQRMQNLKKKLIDNTIAVLGRAYQFEGNTSIYYFIGDLIKRNYKIISDYISDSLRRERAKEVTRQQDVFQIHGQGSVRQSFRIVNSNVRYYEFSLE